MQTPDTAAGEPIAPTQHTHAVDSGLDERVELGGE